MLSLRQRIAAALPDEAIFRNEITFHDPDGYPFSMKNAFSSFFPKSGHFTEIPATVNLAITPKIVSQSVKLTYIITPIQSPVVPATLKTNAVIGFRVLVPDAGGILINCDNSAGANGRGPWLLFSPSREDASGNPIKP